MKRLWWSFTWWLDRKRRALFLWFVWKLPRRLAEKVMDWLDAVCGYDRDVKQGRTATLKQIRGLPCNRPMELLTLPISSKLTRHLNGRVKVLVRDGQHV